MAAEHAHDDEHRLDVSSVSVMLILLIAFTLTSEKLLHALHRRLGHGASVGQEIFHKVKDELMLVGVLTLLLDVRSTPSRRRMMSWRPSSGRTACYLSRLWCLWRSPCPWRRPAQH